MNPLSLDHIHLSLSDAFYLPSLCLSKNNPVTNESDLEPSLINKGDGPD